MFTVFLDEANLVKLGDFGLSKALVQASFANTYVGVCVSTMPVLRFVFVLTLSRRHTTCLRNSCRKRHTTLSLIYGRLAVSSMSFVH